MYQSDTLAVYTFKLNPNKNKNCSRYVQTSGETSGFSFRVSQKSCLHSVTCLSPMIPGAALCSQCWRPAGDQHNQRFVQRMQEATHVQSPTGRERWAPPPSSSPRARRPIGVQRFVTSPCLKKVFLRTPPGESSHYLPHLYPHVCIKHTGVLQLRWLWFSVHMFHCVFPQIWSNSFHTSMVQACAHTDTQFNIQCPDCICESSPSTVRQKPVPHRNKVSHSPWRVDFTVK